MGSAYREPRRKSPERINLKSIDFAGFDDGHDSVRIQATFVYYTWCCNGSHEVSDAVAALERLVLEASERAEKKRLKKAREEYSDLLNTLNQDDHFQLRDSDRAD